MKFNSNSKLVTLYYLYKNKEYVRLEEYYVKTKTIILKW